MNRTVGIVPCPACTHIVSRTGLSEGEVAQGMCARCGKAGVRDRDTCPIRQDDCAYCDERGIVTIDRAVAFYFRKS